MKIIAFLAIILLSVPSFAFAAVLQSNEGSSIDTENFGTSDGKGQSFLHDADFDLESIEIWGGLGDSPASTITVSIYDGEGMAGTLLCSESSVDVSGWPNWSSADWQIITISCPGLTASTQYTFEVTTDDGSTNDGVRWATSNVGYSDGTEYYAQVQRGTRDTMFRINGTESGSPPPTSTTTDATSTAAQIQIQTSLLAMFFSFIVFIVGLMLPLALWRYFKQ